MPAQRKKIYWLHSHFLYWMGGTKYIYEVIKRLSLDFEIIVIVENSSSYAVDLYKGMGVKLISLNKVTSTSPLYWLTLPYQIFDTYLRVRHYMHDKNGVVIASMFPLNTVARLIGRPYYQLCFEPFAFFHDPDFIAGFSRIKRLFITLLKVCYSWLDVIATKAAVEIITLNQVTQKGILSRYGRKSIPVYTGIDTKHFYPHVSSELKRKYKGHEIIMHSTDYTPVKGTDKMIRIFAKIKAVRPKSVLLITSTIANGEAVKNLQSIAKSLRVHDSIEFLGFVDYDILPQLYTLSQVLVQCSFSELSGTTSMALPVKEALACGTLCIRSPVTTEDVIDGVTGYLVDPRNESLMVKRTLDILSLKPAVHTERSKIARSTILSRYSWDHTVKKISSIIK